MKIGYDEKTDAFFITEMTEMEAGVIFASVAFAQYKFQKTSKEKTQKVAKDTAMDIKDLDRAMTAVDDIIKGLVAARKLKDAIKKP